MNLRWVEEKDFLPPLHGGKDSWRGGSGQMLQDLGLNFKRH